MKKIIKYLFVFILLLVGVVGLTNKVIADETTDATTEERTKINLYMFRGEGCGYCAKALEWFDSIKETEGKYFNLVTYEVWNDESNKAIMDKVPYIIVGDKSFQGFDESYKEQILEKVHTEYNKSDADRFDVIKNIEAGIDKKKDNMISYVIVGLIIVGAVFVVVARNKSGSDDSVNFDNAIKNLVDA